VHEVKSNNTKYTHIMHIKITRPKLNTHTHTHTHTHAHTHP